MYATEGRETRQPASLREFWNFFRPLPPETVRSFYESSWDTRNRKSHEPSHSASYFWPIHLARLHSSRSDEKRRTAAPDYGRRPDGHDFQSLDFREGR